MVSAAAALQRHGPADEVIGPNVIAVLVEKKLLAESMLDNAALKDFCQRNGGSAAKRERPSLICESRWR